MISGAGARAITGIACPLIQIVVAVRITSRCSTLGQSSKRQCAWHERTHSPLQASPHSARISRADRTTRRRLRISPAPPTDARSRKTDRASVNRHVKLKQIVAALCQAACSEHAPDARLVQCFAQCHLARCVRRSTRQHAPPEHQHGDGNGGQHDKIETCRPISRVIDRKAGHQRTEEARNRLHQAYSCCNCAFDVPCCPRFRRCAGGRRYRRRTTIHSAAPRQTAWQETARNTAAASQGSHSPRQ